jgi:CDGSH-type Zn-finger protein
MPDSPEEHRPEATVVGPVTIRCRENGPLVVDLPILGGVELRLRVIDHTGAEYPLPGHKRAVALCRCGSSDSKPFCDGSHKTNGFHGGTPASP